MQPKWRIYGWELTSDLTQHPTVRRTESGELQGSAFEGLRFLPVFDWRDSTFHFHSLWKILARMNPRPKTRYARPDQRSTDYLDHIVRVAYPVNSLRLAKTILWFPYLIYFPSLYRLQMLSSSALLRFAGIDCRPNRRLSVALKWCRRRQLRPGL